MADRCNCDDCEPNPAVVCSFTGEEVSVLSVYIANAYRGDLILSPGGPAGQIGGLLHQLVPPQHYSHMGIMVRNHDLIRHSTASPQRLTSDEYYTSDVLGVPAPLNGLNPDHLQYGWPGTVTQSAEQAIYADRYGHDFPPPGSTERYRGADLIDPESPSDPKKTYLIAALSFDEAFDGGEWYPALVVKPCPLLSTETVKAALDQIVDRVMQTYGHYRFYCYTDGAIGGDLNRLGPATKLPRAQPEWDPVSMKWRDWSELQLKDLIDVPATVPAVCSSLIWQAVQEVNRGKPTIVLDWARTRQEALGIQQLKSAGYDVRACPRAVEPDGAADHPFTRDGLYVYDEESRKKAGKWLYGSISDEVFSKLKSGLADTGTIGKVVADVIDDLGRPSFIAAATAGTAPLLAALSGIPGVAPVLPALTTVFLTKLIELLYEMPDRIANQVCNSFAFDCHRGFPRDTHCVDATGKEIKDVDSENWGSAPGRGAAVSPDDIHMFWDAPGPSSAREIQQGIYGFNTPVQPVIAVVKRPVCELVPSTGTATLHGFVTLAGRAVPGAVVEVNCQRTTTGRGEGDYSLAVRSGGQLRVVARFEDPARRVVLYGQRSTGGRSDPPIAPNSTVRADISLVEPPACLRNVRVEVTVRVDDVYLTGADHDEKSFRKDLLVQYGVASFDEGRGKWVIDVKDPAAAARRTDVKQVGASVGDANGQLKIEVEAKGDLSVDVTVTGTIGNLTESHSVNVKDAATATIPEFDLDTGGPFNDRAYFRGLTITNRAATAI